MVREKISKFAVGYVQNLFYLAGGVAVSYLSVLGFVFIISLLS